MRVPKKVHLGLTGLIVAVGALVALNLDGSTIQAVNSFRNCNDDAIIRCGAITQAELLQNYDQNVGDVQNIYRHYGITRGDLAGTASQIKHGTVYQDGRVVVDGKTVATGAYSLSRVKYTSAGTPRTVSINGKTYYEGPSMQIFTGAVDAFVYMRSGKFYKAVLSSCGNPLIATPPTTPPAPEPVHTCDSLKATKIDRTRYRFTAAATAKNGAKIVSYTFTFGDGKSQTSSSNTIRHTYDQPGSYNVSVSVNVKVDGETIVVDGQNCKTTVTVDEKPVKPAYKCESLTAQLIQGTDRTYAYTLKYMTEGDVTLTEVTYNFGDSTSETFSAADATTVEHQFATAGAYTTTATLYFNVKNGDQVTEKTATCKVNISIPAPDDCPIPGKEHLPKDSPECKEDVEYCPIPGKEHLPKDSDECEETPPELPTTGLGMFIGGSLGLGSISAAGYYWSASRRNLLDTFLSKK